MKHAVAGLVLALAASTVAWKLWGTDAAVAAAAAGLLATAIETWAVMLLRRVLVPPFERVLKGWGAGLGLRLGGLALVAAAVQLRPARFPVLPTALGFLAVLIPLMLGEMWLVWTQLRTTR